MTFGEKERTVSDDYLKYHDWNTEDGEEYEEISSEEVDRVVAALDQLLATVESENIKTYLELASNSIFFLVYESEEEGETGSGPVADAA